MTVRGSTPSGAGSRLTRSSRLITSTLSIILILSGCGKHAIPTSVEGPTQNALVAVVRVQPSSAVIEPDASVDLSTLVRGARGQVVRGRPVTWKTSDDRVAYVDATGRIIAGEEGTATITANVLGVEGQATIDVRGDVTGILIDSPLTDLVEGSAERLSATFVYSNGATRPARGVRWSSADPTRLWVDGEGDATGRVVGDVSVHVDGRGKNGRKKFRISSGHIASVTLFASATTLTVGSTGHVWADVRNSEGGKVSKSVAWRTSNESVVSVDGEGRIAALAVGTSTLTGIVSGVSGSLDLVVVPVSSGSGSSSGSGGSATTVVAPSQVTDLAVSEVAERTVRLTFTEVDDGTGQPADYSVRYGLASEFSWDGAVPVSKGTCSSPLTGTRIGEDRSCRVDGLVSAEDYRFQLVAFRRTGGDPARVFGELSNVAAGRTSDAGIVVDVTPSAFQIDVGNTHSLNASITDTYGNAVSGTVTWTSTSSTVASVATNGGNGTTVSANAVGQAAIRASFNGVSGSSSATITQPASDGGGSTGGGSTGGGSTGGGSTPPPPPPPSGQQFFGDFSSATSDADLQSMVTVATVNNVHAEPGVGMRYDFQPFPTRCGDQSLTSTVSLPKGTKQVWMDFRIRFSSNWTTVNPNCSSPAPDYKTVLTWLGDRKAVTGHQRFDLKLGQGGGNIHASGPGWPSRDVVPVAVVQQPGARSLFDGQWHRVEMHQALVGDNEMIVQIRIDGQLTHNYRSHTTTGLMNNWLRQVNIGANRNLGATSLMHVWWDDFQVWVGSNDPGFGFPAPTRY